MPPNLWWAFPWHLLVAVDPVCSHPLALLPASESRSTWTVCYTLRHTVERRFKPLGNFATWTNFFRLSSCCFFICTIKVSHRPQRTAVRLKSQNVCRVSNTVSSKVLATEYQLCYHYHYFCRSLLNLLQYLFPFMFLVFWPPGVWDLSFPTRDRTHTLTPCIGRWSLNSWTAREGPLFFITNSALAKLLICQHVWLQVNPLCVLVKYMLTSFVCPPPPSLLPTHNFLPPLSPEERTSTSRFPHRSLHSAVMPQGSQLPPYPI